eukprot:2453125-Pyramimonas_sp.AAC.1
MSTIRAQYLQHARHIQTYDGRCKKLNPPDISCGPICRPDESISLRTKAAFDTSDAPARPFERKERL